MRFVIDAVLLLRTLLFHVAHVAYFDAIKPACLRPARRCQVPDPVIQLTCLDASLAMKPIFGKFQTVVITSGTLSPIDLYPKILNFQPVAVSSLNMTLTRDCMCPVVLTRGADQMPVSTKFDMRGDAGVIRNYGR